MLSLMKLDLLLTSITNVISLDRDVEVVLHVTRVGNHSLERLLLRKRSSTVLTIEVPNFMSQIWDLYCKHCYKSTSITRQVVFRRGSMSSVDLAVRIGIPGFLMNL